MLGALVHRNARDEAIERTRHLLFIGIRLALVLTALVCVPPYLIIQGKPSPIDAIVFAWAMAPLASVWVAIRTGDLLRAHTLSVLGLIGMATTAALGAPGISIAAMLWLVLAPLDAIFAFSMPLILATGGMALAAVFGIALLKMTGIAITGMPVSEMTSSIMISLAVVYVCAMALGALQLNEARRRKDTIGTARYNSLSEAIGDLVLRLDRTGAVLFAGSGSHKLLGLSSREISGRGLFERVHVADRPAFLKAAADAVQFEQTASAVLRIRIASGEEGGAYPAEPVFRWFEIRAHAIVLEETVQSDRERLQILAILRDVTDAKTYEAELQTARIEAETANKWKDRFLANVSHELRTPLNAIIGFSEMLGNTDLRPADAGKQIEYARIINESGQHLLSVVNTILDMSKIEAGSFDLFPEPFDVKSLVDQCCGMLQLKAEMGRVTLLRDYDDNLEELVADKRAVKQVLLNLISNAIKFTPENGVVKIAVRPEGNSIIFDVNDTGIGIPAADLYRLGDPFFQARAAHDRPYEGTGLGLSVVRGLIGLHGGSIQIESAQGEGTRVVARFPLDCRTVTRDTRTSAKIEAIPMNKGTGVKQLSNLQDMVKKIA